MDGLTATLLVIVITYALRAKESAERIRLLGEHLQALQIERLLEQLHTGYQRALNESDPQRRSFVWQQLEPAERQLASQVQTLAKAFSSVPSNAAKLSKWSGLLPYITRWWPQKTFTLSEALQIHAEGMSRTAENREQLSQKQKAFRMTAEMLLFQHTCHWFCKGHSVATARMVIRHQTSPEQAINSVHPTTRQNYLELRGSSSN